MTAPPLDAVVPMGTHPELALAEDRPDVRGWEVTSPAFTPLGVVEDLLVDTTALCVRYLVVATAAEDARRRILLPIGKARIDDALDRIVVATPSCLDSVPEYDASAPLTREHERSVLAGFGERGGEEHDFYRCPAFAHVDFYAAHHQRQQCGRRDGDDAGSCARTAAPAEAPLADELGLELKVVPRDDE